MEGNRPRSSIHRVGALALCLSVCLGGCFEDDQPIELLKPRVGIDTPPNPDPEDPPRSSAPSFSAEESDTDAISPPTEEDAPSFPGSNPISPEDTSVPEVSTPSEPEESVFPDFPIVPPNDFEERPAHFMESAGVPFDSNSGRGRLEPELAPTGREGANEVLTFKAFLESAFHSF